MSLGIDPLFSSWLAATTILCYDYSLTFQDEVRFVWSRKFSFGMVLFLLVRYMPVTDILLNILAKELTFTPKGCSRLYHAMTTLAAFSIAFSELILVLRTIAIWRGNVIVTRLMILFSVAALACALYVTNVFAKTTIAGAEKIGRCKPETFDRIGYLDFISIIFIETVVVLFTVVKAVKHAGRTNSAWLARIYRTGIIYFVWMFCMTLANLLFLTTVPLPWNGILVSPQRVLHSVLCSRVVFLLLNGAVPNCRSSSNFEGDMSTRLEFRVSGPRSMLDTMLDLEIFSSPSDGENETSEVSRGRTLRRR